MKFARSGQPAFAYGWPGVPAGEPASGSASRRHRASASITPATAYVAAERELRAIAVGRRNWTFAGSDEGGRRAAALYTLIATARSPMRTRARCGRQAVAGADLKRVTSGGSSFGNAFPPIATASLFRCRRARSPPRLTASSRSRLPQGWRRARPVRDPPSRARGLFVQSARRRARRRTSGKSSPMGASRSAAAAAARAESVAAFEPATGSLQFAVLQGDFTKMQGKLI